MYLEYFYFLVWIDYQHSHVCLWFGPLFHILYICFSSGSEDGTNKMKEERSKKRKEKEKKRKGKEKEKKIVNI